MRKTLAILLAGVLALSLAACAPAAADPTPTPTAQVTETPEPTATPTEPASSETVYPVTVTDMAGREVTIAAEPERIVSGYYISSSACIALGLTERFVGIEAKAAERPIYSLAAPQLIELPNVGTAKAFDLETCLATEPDLVILPMSQQETAQALEELDIPALLVMPESHEQILEMFALIGEATNTVSQAQALSTYYTDLLDKVAERTAGLSEEDKPVVYMGGTSSYLTTAPAGMYQASLITAAGGVNAADSIEGSSWTEISYEQLLAMDPDVIVIPTNSFATGAPDYAAGDLMADEQLSEVTAVSSGAVYQMISGFEAWDSPAPSGILGTLWMLKTLHPDLYSQEEFVTDVQDFYTTFYGFTPAAEDLAS